MADNKDITEQTKQSIRTIKSEAETGVNFVKQEAKSAKSDIKNTGKEVSGSIKQASDAAVENIKKQQTRSVDAIDNAFAKAQTSFDRTVDKTISQATEQFDDGVNSIVDRATGNLQQTASQAAIDLDRAKEKSVESINKVAEEQKKKLGESVAKPEGGGRSAPDLATKLLQDILSEVKVLRKITEGRVTFDAKSGRYRGAGGRYVKESDIRETQAATREKDEKEKKRKGMFGDLRNKFVVAKKQLAPVAEGAKQVGEGVSGLATNPLVIAGLLAFLAPKEVLSFIKGFLGEILFGDSANAFTQSIGAFVALWAGFKVFNAFKNLITVIKGLWTVARFLFVNPVLTLALVSIVAAAQLISDFKEKYGKRMKRMALEDELKQLESSGADPARAEQIRKELAKLGQEGVYSTPQQARRAALTGANTKVDLNNSDVQAGIERIAEYDRAVEKQKAGQQLTPNEQDTLKTFKNRDEIFESFGFRTPDQKAAVEQAVQKKKQPTAQARPQPTTTTPADAAQNDRELSRAASQTTQPASASVPPSAQETAGPKLEPPTPSTGLSISESSAAVEAGYEETPEDSTTVVSQDMTQIPKKANVIDSIPGIIPDRSSFSMYERFGVVPLPQYA